MGCNPATQRKAEMAFKVYLWQMGALTSSTGKLFDFWMSAAPCDRAKLLSVFPDEIGAIQEWHESKSPDAYWQKYGIGIRGVPVTPEGDEATVEWFPPQRLRDGFEP
jgi:hypothetical protein